MGQPQVRHGICGCSVAVLGREGETDSPPADKTIDVLIQSVAGLTKVVEQNSMILVAMAKAEPPRQAPRYPAAPGQNWRPNSRPTDRSCFNCGAQGHFRRDCPQPARQGNDQRSQ